MIYRVSRKPPPPPPEEKIEEKIEEKAHDELKEDCSCDESHEPMPPITKNGKECTVCRERPPRDYCPNDSHSPPPTPPPSHTSTRTRCPCENNPRHASNMAAPNPPPTSLSIRDEVHPARELFGEMHAAAARVLRNVVEAVMGNPNRVHEGGEPYGGCTTFAANEEITQEPNEPLEEGEEQLLSRHRRTGPRLCVPATSGGDQGDKSETQPRPVSSTQSQPPPVVHNRYRGLDDDFSELYFDDFVE